MEEQTHTNTPWAGHTRYQLEVGRVRVRGSQWPTPARLRLPSSARRIQALGLWRSRVGAREVGAQKDRPPPSAAPHHHAPASFFPVICARGKAQLGSWRRCLLPRLRGKAAAWDLGLHLSLPSLGAQCLGHTVWEQVGGRVSHSLPLCGHFGPQHQPRKEALGGGREPLRRVSCGQLFSGR